MLGRGQATASTVVFRRRGSLADHEMSGVELLLDCSALACDPAHIGTGCYDLLTRVERPVRSLGS